MTPLIAALTCLYVFLLLMAYAIFYVGARREIVWRDGE